MVGMGKVEATNHPLTMLSFLTYKIGPTFYLLYCNLYKYISSEMVHVIK